LNATAALVLGCCWTKSDRIASQLIRFEAIDCVPLLRGMNTLGAAFVPNAAAQSRAGRLIQAVSHGR
jgi:hypothetical protein